MTTNVSNSPPQVPVIPIVEGASTPPPKDPTPPPAASTPPASGTPPVNGTPPNGDDGGSDVSLVEAIAQSILGNLQAGIQEGDICNVFAQAFAGIAGKEDMNGEEQASNIGKIVLEVFKGAAEDEKVQAALRKQAENFLNDIVDQLHDGTGDDGGKCCNLASIFSCFGKKA